LIVDSTLKKNSIVKLKGWNSNKVSQKRFGIRTRPDSADDVGSSSCWTSRFCRSTASPRESATR
jgi:hypothetical protein